MGLFLTKKIIEGHNGHIWVESEEGKDQHFILHYLLRIIIFNNFIHFINTIYYYIFYKLVYLIIFYNLCQ